MLVALFLVGITLPVFAAVENVKVGGDITIKGIYRYNFDIYSGGSSQCEQHNYYTGTRIWVSADLTNKLSVLVRMINERDWNRPLPNMVVSPFPGLDLVTPNSLGVDLDLAYIKIADFMTPGLNLTVGRQEIQIGEGLVVGSAYNALTYIDGNYLHYPLGYPWVSIANTDLGLRKSFDAIKFDYNFATKPISISAFMSKILDVYSPSLLPVSDMDLYAVSLKWAPQNGSVEPYIVYLAMPVGETSAPDEGFSLMTYGVRGAVKPQAVPGLSLKGELAAQSGSLFSSDAAFKGFAGYLGLGYEFQSALKPAISFGYNYYTGDDAGTNGIEAWVPVFASDMGSRMGNIAYNVAYQMGPGSATFFPIGESNLAIWKLGFSIQPTEKFGLGITYFNESLNETTGEAGFCDEVDLGLSYAYTEDLGMGLDIGYFIPGNAFGSSTDNAWQAIATLKLAF